MNAFDTPLAQDPFLANTHDVTNVSRELQDYNLYRRDQALQEAVLREGAGWDQDALSAFGELAGRADYLALGALANKHQPEFDTHDRFGNRIDLVTYHPSYHQLMKTAIEHGLHSLPWTHPGPGAHVARATRNYMQAQVEAGHGCPITMTFAAIPALRHAPALLETWGPKITARVYDPRNLPAEQKAGVTVGMGMTEKQGGSDVRANSTRAYPLGNGGIGEPYQLVGHKFFLSAPMCDLFLVLAHTERGLSCFLVPRWLEDGTKNPLQVIRLKKKMGNASNASSEVEFRGALGWLVGEEGRGVPTIIEMVSATRFDCMVGSAAGMRMAVSQAIHHCQHRAAFGKTLIDQPLMKNVLADLALESEAAMATALRVARGLDESADEQQRLFVRLATAVGKYWICKRTPQHAYEAMECIGGSGVMEDSMMPRLYREAPINAIWEGSGNVQCLDVLRALQKSPQVLDAFYAEISKAAGGNRHFDQHLGKLKDGFQVNAVGEFNARYWVDQLALALQASLLVQHAPDAVSAAFCQSRLALGHQGQYGTLSDAGQVSSILQRAWQQ